MDRKTKCLSLIYTLETFPSHPKIPALKAKESNTPLGAYRWRHSIFLK